MEEQQGREKIVKDSRWKNEVGLIEYVKRSAVVVLETIDFEEVFDWKQKRIHV